MPTYGPCPLCGKENITSDRYPRAICKECVSRAVDEEGRRMRVRMSRGMIFTAEVEKDGGWLRLEGDSAMLFVDGHRCVAQEDYWGDVTVQLA